MGIVGAMRPVFADVDTGVDDAVALIYLLASPDTELVGIGCTGGNVEVDRVCANNLALLALCAAPAIPVSVGAAAPLAGPGRTAPQIHGPQGLGYAVLPPADAAPTGYDTAHAWIAAARAHPGRLTGLVSGPLTNLALALRAEPALPTLLDRLVIMGGAMDRAAPEFNISVDPLAAAEVFAAWAATAPRRLPVLCPLELTRQVVLTPESLARLAAAAPAGSALIGLLDDALRFYFEAHAARGQGYRAYLHDPLAAAAALEPHLVATRPAAVHVDLTDIPGRTTADFTAPPNALLGVGVDPAAFFDRLIGRVGALATRLG